MELIEVYCTSERIELITIKSLLESNNIPFIVKGEVVGDIYGITVDGLAEKRIFVNKEDAEKAKELIKGFII